MERIHIVQRILKYSKALIFILLIPLVALVFLILNLFTIFAPKCMFKFVTTKILSRLHLNDWKNNTNISEMSDIGFIFSLDMFKVKPIKYFDKSYLCFYFSGASLKVLKTF